jgi:hypothetical protein
MRRPEALGRGVVALVEKGVKRVEDGLDAAVFAARFGWYGHGNSPLRDRQHVIEANSGILLPEPQHRLQIVRRKSDVDDVFCQLHLPTVTRTTYP